MAQDQTRPDRLTRLLQQKAQLDAKIESIKARKLAQNRKDDTRRKIIAGSLALEHAKRHEAFGTILAELLDQFVIRPQDRSLFDLPPLPEITQDNERPQTPLIATFTRQK